MSTSSSRACAIIALIISIIVIIVEIPWISRGTLAVVIIAIAIASALNAIAIIGGKE